MRKIFFVVVLVLVSVFIFGSMVGDLHKTGLDRGYEFFTYRNNGMVYLIVTCDNMEESFLMLNYEDNSFSLVVNVEKGEHVETEFLHYTALYGVPKEIYLTFIKLEPGESEFIHLNDRLVGVIYAEDTDRDMMVAQEN